MKWFKRNQHIIKNDILQDVCDLEEGEEILLNFSFLKKEMPDFSFIPQI